MSANDQTKTHPDALPDGYRFNEFEIKEVIGDGGFGIVYRAWDHQLERTVAIKEYLPVSLAMRSADLTLTLRSERGQKLFDAGLACFIQEARLLARFNHPGLLHVLRFWEQNGTAYMGTLCYSGMTLKAWQLTRSASITEAWIRRLLPPLLGAIGTLHQAGYLHRDISLDNIQIQENQLPVLLDFGSARKEIGNLSDETEIMLKPGFAPIEQYSEEGEADQGPWTDIYALGAVLHSLITGSPPPVSVVRCIEDNYQPLVERQPAGYSLPLLHAVDRALAMKPDDRPQTIDAFAALIALPVSDVEAIINSLPMAAAPSARLRPGRTESLSPPVTVITPSDVPAHVTRRPAVWLGLAGGVILAGIVAVWLISRDSPVPETATRVAQSPVPASPAAVVPTALATVYFRLESGESVVLNGQPVAVKPGSNGFAALNLAAGQYTIEVGSGSRRASQSLTIDRPGTWLINPGR